MRTRLLLLGLTEETDIVVVRERTREVATLLAFDVQDRTRITTAVSEIARNAWDYGGGGRVEFWLADEGSQQALEIIVRDTGKGIADLDAVLSGDYRSSTGMGLGIIGARRLMEGFEVETKPGTGTVVRMSKPLPRRPAAVTRKDVGRLTQSLTRKLEVNPLGEVRRQNQEMMVQLDELYQRQQELARVNQELQDTNRGVVALYAELDERADHLRRADELKSRFLSNMSHEFRTPLNSVMALSRLLLSRADGALSPEQERQVQYIRKAAESLTELVNDLLDLAKVEAGKIVVMPIEFAAASLFGALRGMLRPLLVGDAVQLTFEEAGDIPILFTDEGKVSQILRNFISNAIKFTEHGEVRVWAQHDGNDDTVTFAVRDTGVGIAAEQLDLIWQEFAQLSNPLQRKVKGTGLGLPLSKKLAELLGGTVAVESAPGQGSVFRLIVPRVHRLPSDAETDGDWTLEPGRLPVLVVEDNAADAFALERALADTRYQPLSVSNLSAARRALQRATPVAILLDILLVGEESWRFLLEMKQHQATEHIPIIIVSSSHEEQKARSLGADEYFDKSVEPAELVKALDGLTGGRSVTRVLIVDDEEVSRYLVRQLLPRGSFELSEASTGVDGLRRLVADQPDIVLLDLNMAGMDGFTFLDRLTSDATTAVPAVVLTSMSLTLEQQRRLRPAAQIIAKSELSSGMLVSAIRQALEARPA